MMTPLPLEGKMHEIRADAPSLDRRIFLMSCGASIMPQPVVQAMHDYLDLEADVGGYAAAEMEADRIAGVHSSVARLLNAMDEEIALVENATVAWQKAFYSLPFKPGDAVMTVEAEYAANYVAYLQLKKRHGIEIRVVPSDGAGQVDLDAVEAMIDDKVKLISVTWVPTNGGLANPAREIGLIARRHGIPYLLDACQAVGQMPVDVRELNCDFLAGTSRKFLRGPRGAGFLYVRKEKLAGLDPVIIDHWGAPWLDRDHYELRPDARRFETWESNCGNRIGMGLAIDYALALGLDQIEARCQVLSDRLRSGLGDIPGVEVLDLGTRPSAITSFRVEGMAAGEVVRRAAARDVVIGVTSKASTLIDAERRGLAQHVRAAPHYFNTIEEIDGTVELIADLVRGTHAS